MHYTVMTEVYSWRVSAEKKAELESEARREGISLAELLDQATADWRRQRRNSRKGDNAEQSAMRERAAAAIGSLRGGDPLGPHALANWFARS